MFDRDEVLRLITAYQLLDTSPSVDVIRSIEPLHRALTGAECDKDRVLATLKDVETAHGIWLRKKLDRK